MSSAYNKSDVEEFIKSAKQKKMTSFQVMIELEKFLLEKEGAIGKKATTHTDEQDKKLSQNDVA